MVLELREKFSCKNPKALVYVSNIRWKLKKGDTSKPQSYLVKRLSWMSSKIS